MKKYALVALALRASSCEQAERPDDKSLHLGQETNQLGVARGRRTF
jgi:hypothetical protein